MPEKTELHVLLWVNSAQLVGVVSVDEWEAANLAASQRTFELEDPVVVMASGAVAGGAGQIGYLMIPAVTDCLEISVDHLAAWALLEDPDAPILLMYRDTIAEARARRSGIHLR
jgi:hypothetical protein